MAGKDLSNQLEDRKPSPSDQQLAQRAVSSRKNEQRAGELASHNHTPADPALIPQGFVVRRTFIDVAVRLNGQRRAKSCGDQPSHSGDWTATGTTTSPKRQCSATETPKAKAKQLLLSETSSSVSECSASTAGCSTADDSSSSGVAAQFDESTFPSPRQQQRPQELNSSKPMAQPQQRSQKRHGMQQRRQPKPLIQQSPLQTGQQPCTQQMCAQAQPLQQQQQPRLSLLELLPEVQVHAACTAQTTPKQPSQPIGGARHPPRRRESCGEYLSLDAASNACEVLHLTQQVQGWLSLVDVVAALHAIAKFVDGGLLGPLCPQPEVATSALLRDTRYLSLLAQLKLHAASLDTPRIIMKAVWALGKVGGHGSDVEMIVQELTRIVPWLLPRFSTQEMSNTLWGLARLATMARGGVWSAPHAMFQLAAAIIDESRRRVVEMSAQCLSNSLWAVSKLELSDAAACDFVAACIAQIRLSKFRDMLPQGLANCLWAVGRLRSLPHEVAVDFCAEAAAQATGPHSRLSHFQPQELSMALWGTAKTVGKGMPKRQGSRHLPLSVENFAEEVSREALRRLSDFTPQGVSNIAWSLATMDLLKRESVKNFILAAAQMSAPALHDFPPQAIANFSWAVSKLRLSGGEALVAFSVAAATEAIRRQAEFSWQDLSGIATALMHVELPRAPQVLAFTLSLVYQAVPECGKIGTQALLNIALAAVRLGVSKEDLTPLAWAISATFTKRINDLNDIDMRQFSEVQRYCCLPGTPELRACPDRSNRGGQRRRR